MGTTNRASSGWTAIQVGRVLPPADDDDQEPQATPERPAAKGATVNIRTGNAKVGVQADEITGDIVIGRRKK
jgi:hypothetical protein